MQDKNHYKCQVTKYCPILSYSISPQLLCRGVCVCVWGGGTRLGYQEASRILMNSCQGYELWNEHFTLGLFMFLIIPLIHIAIYLYH